MNEAKVDVDTKTFLREANEYVKVCNYGYSYCLSSIRHSLGVVWKGAHEWSRLRDFQAKMLCNVCVHRRDTFVVKQTGGGKTVLLLLHDFVMELLESKGMLLYIVPTRVLSSEFGSFAPNVLAVCDTVSAEDIRSHCQKHPRP